MATLEKAFLVDLLLRLGFEDAETYPPELLADIQAKLSSKYQREIARGELQEAVSFFSEADGCNASANPAKAADPSAQTAANIKQDLDDDTSIAGAHDDKSSSSLSDPSLLHFVNNDAVNSELTSGKSAAADRPVLGNRVENSRQRYVDSDRKESLAPGTISINASLVGQEMSEADEISVKLRGLDLSGVHRKIAEQKSLADVESGNALLFAKESLNRHGNTLDNQRNTFDKPGNTSTLSVDKENLEEIYYRAQEEGLEDDGSDFEGEEPEMVQYYMPRGLLVSSD